MLWQNNKGVWELMQEKILFELWKNTVITGTEYRRIELQRQFPDVNINKLHRDIVNYQVKKYGTSLNNQRSLNDFEKVARRAKERRRKKLGK